MVRVRQVSIAVAALVLASSAGSTAGAAETWIFSAYAGLDQKRIIIGPFESFESCADAREGYLRNDSYRDVSACTHQ